MPTIINPRTGAIVRVPYGNDAPGDINAQGGVEGDPYGPSPAAPVDPLAPKIRYDPDGRRVGVSYPKQTVVIDVDGQPRITIAEDFVADPRPSAGRAGRDPSAVALDQAQLDRIRQQIDMEPEKLALEAELGRGRLGVSLAEVEIARQRAEVERLIATEGSWYQREQAAIARGELEEARRAAMEREKIAVRRQDLEERLGFADSARKDVQVGIQRADVLGYVPDDALGVAAGTPTAKERQQRFENVRSVGQAVQAAGERQLDRRREDARYTSQREDNAIQRDLQQMQMAEQGRQFEVQNQQAVASRRRPAVFTPGMVVSRAGAY